MNDREFSPSPETVYREFSGLVSRLCFRMIRNKSEAEDAAQDAWIEIMKALPSFEGRSKLSTWIWTITRRAVFRHIRREKLYSTRFLRELFAMNAEDGLPELERIPVEDRTAWVKLQCSDCLTAILHCVPNDDRFVYLLRRLVNLPYAEIAAVVGESEPAVRQSCSRSMRKIGRFLEGECSLYNPAGSCRCKMREPIRHVDRTGEYERVRDLSRRMLFLDSADSWYASVPDYWKPLPERDGILKKA
jgi:RNA polymerase sigma-70 factor (ECF subfamily)